MLIAQENNIEHYPIAFNVFLLPPILEKYFDIFFQDGFLGSPRSIIA